MSGQNPLGFQGLKITETASFTRGGRATIDFDGSPTAYAPAGSGLPAQDFLANAGHEGNWWALVTDTGRKDGTPIVDPQTGYYISATAWGRSREGKREYVNSDEIPYVAITKADRDQRGIQYGDFVLLTNDQTGKQVWAIAADYAGGKEERNTHSEVSAAAIRALGIDYTKRGIRGPSATQRGETTISMQFFPGSKIQGFFPSGTEGAQTVAMGPQAYRDQTLLAMSNTPGAQRALVAAAAPASAPPSPAPTLTGQARTTFRPQQATGEADTARSDTLAQTQIRDIQTASDATALASSTQSSSTEGGGSVLANGLMGEGDSGKMMGLLVAVMILGKIFGVDESPNQDAFGHATGTGDPSSEARIAENASDTDTDGNPEESEPSSAPRPQRSSPALA